MKIPYFVTVIDGRGDLSEDSTSFRFRKDFTLAQVVVELATSSVLHHQYHLLFIFKH